MRAQPLDGRIEGDHRIGRSVTGGIRVKAAGDLDGLVEEGGEPLGVGAGAGGGDAAMARIEGKATDGVDGRFTEDDRLRCLRGGGRDGKEAQVLSGAVTIKPVQIFAGLAFCECGNKMYVPSNSPKYVCQKCQNKIPIVDLEGIQTDMEQFFATPIPAAIWAGLRDFQNHDFVWFVESHF